MQIDYQWLPARLQHIYTLLHPYQRDAIFNLKVRQRCMLDANMGAGKSLMALVATMENQPKKVLIACTKNALYTWQKEIALWFPEISTDKYFKVAVGTVAQRMKAYSEDALFYLTTYQALNNDVKKRMLPLNAFDTLLVDEAHRSGLRNQKTVGYATFKIISPLIKYIYYISGTFISIGPQQLWPFLNTLAPKKFASYWGFVNKFCEFIDTPFGKEYIGPQNSAALDKTLAPHLVRIPRTITDEQLPPMTRHCIDIKLNDMQAKVYKQLKTELWTALANTEKIIVAQNDLSLLTKLRQICVCPKILGVDDYGIGIDVVAERLEDSDNMHSVIFTPFRSAVPHFKEYLQQRFPTTTISYLWGGLDMDDVRERITCFKRTQGIMICSIAFAQSFELNTANKGFFIGYDWDANNNYQAEARLRRISSTSSHIDIYYLRHADTIEQHELNLLDQKVRNVKMTYQTIDQLKSILK